VVAGPKSGNDFERTTPEPIAQLRAERRSTAFDAILAEGSFESTDARPVSTGGRPPPGDPHTRM
jgi:hypothetical protein